MLSLNQRMYLADKILKDGAEIAPSFLFEYTF